MIGGDLKVDKYRFRARPQNLDFILFPPDHSLKSKSMLSSIILLCKIALDTDPFFMYEDIFKCGIIETLLITLIIMILINLSIQLFTKCWFYGTAYNYSDIWTSVFGSKTFNFVPIVLNIISYLTYICWYNFEIHECTATFLKTVWPKVPTFIVNKYFLLYIINFITTFPCLFFTNITSFTSIAIVGNIAMVVSVFCLIILLIRSICEMGFEITVNKLGSIDNDDDILPYLPYTTLFSKDASSLFGCIGTIMTAFYMHPFLEMVFEKMQRPTVYRCISSIWITSFFSTLFFYGIGIISYFIVQNHLKTSISNLNMNGHGGLHSDNLSINNRYYNIFSIFKGNEILDFENENIFFNFPKSHVEAMIGQIASIVITITSNMVFTYILANFLSSLVIDRKKDDVKPLIISGIVIILFGIGLNAMDSWASPFLDFISQIAFLILVFVLPSFFYLKLFRFTKPLWGIVSVVLLAIGIPMSVAVIYYSALDI